MAEHLAAGPPATGPYAAAREAAEHALRLQPRDARYMRRAARIEARACLALFRTEACRERVREQYRLAERLSRFEPSIPLELAVFLLELGDPAGARRAAERALTLEPEAVLPRMVLAEALVDSAGRAAVPRAGELLREAEEKARRWSDASGEPSAGQLLSLDRAQFERLRRKLDSLAPATSSSGEGPAT
jgi:tetratricopeptide (TPR) repeat protein